MKRLLDIEHTDWQQSFAVSQQNDAIAAFEQGSVINFPHLAFALNEKEKQFLSPDCVDPKSKNISYDIRVNRLSNTVVEGEARDLLHAMMRRYAEYTKILLTNLFPQYQQELHQARTSYRPVQAKGRKSSSRKDDTCLHVDAFPSTPTGGERIIRVFCNVNPNGEPRVWRVGDRFEEVAERFARNLPKASAIKANFMNIFKLTKSYRTAYDHYMLELHDAMKFDDDYQKNADQQEVQLQPGSTWMVFTDSVPHAAMSGQFMFEQTFHLPVDAMRSPELSPLRILEQKLQKTLV